MRDEKSSLRYHFLAKLQLTFLRRIEFKSDSACCVLRETICIWNRQSQFSIAFYITFCPSLMKNCIQVEINLMTFGFSIAYCEMPFSLYLKVRKKEYFHISSHGRCVSIQASNILYVNLDSFPPESNDSGCKIEPLTYLVTYLKAEQGSSVHKSRTLSDFRHTRLYSCAARVPPSVLTWVYHVVLCQC